jgi:hypothetical protein
VPLAAMLNEDEYFPAVAAGMIAFLCRPESARNVFDMKS